MSMDPTIFEAAEIRRTQPGEPSWYEWKDRAEKAEAQLEACRALVKGIDKLAPIFGGDDVPIRLLTKELNAARNALNIKQ